MAITGRVALILHQAGSAPEYVDNVRIWPTDS